MEQGMAQLTLSLFNGIIEIKAHHKIDVRIKWNNMGGAIVSWDLTLEKVPAYHNCGRYDWYLMKRNWAKDFYL